MNFLGLAESWIANELEADSTLNGLIGEKLFYAVAPEGTQGVYVVYSNVSSSPVYNLGTKRDFSWAEYDIQAYEVGPGTTAIKSVANRIDEMFSKELRDRVFNGYIFGSRLRTELSRKGIDADETVWRALGGTYKISIAKV